MLSDDLRARIDALIQQDRVVLFMKGDRQQPRCGFSAAVVDLLDDLIPSYATVDVLADPAIREGIKEYSDWPTIPQLYVGGEFVGGSDVAKEMAASGELQKLLGVAAPTAGAAAVTVELSDAAARALKRAMQGEEPAHDHLRLSVNGRFQHKLGFGPKLPGDAVVESRGVKIAVDAASVKRADGVKIDFIETPEGGGFKIDNPNEPPKVKQMTVRELKEKLDAGAKLELWDVRTPGEIEAGKIAQARHLDGPAREALLQAPKDAVLAFVCRTGNRSQSAAEHFLQHGFKNVFNVVGGIEAWAREGYPSVRPS
jgi:monothiol glutaredoxin